MRPPQPPEAGYAAALFALIVPVRASAYAAGRDAAAAVLLKFLTGVSGLEGAVPELTFEQALELVAALSYRLNRLGEHSAATQLSTAWTNREWW